MFVVGLTVSTVIKKVSVKVFRLVCKVSAAVISGKCSRIFVLTVAEQIAMPVFSWPNYVTVSLDEKSPSQARWNQI